MRSANHAALSTFAVAIGLAALLLGGCDRRGPLEPPPGAAVPPPAAAAPAPPGKAVPADPRVRPKAGVRPQASAAPTGTDLVTRQGSVVADGPDDEEDEDDLTVAATPSPTPKKRRGRPYVVPNESFVLDPLL